MYLLPLKKMLLYRVCLSFDVECFAIVDHQEFLIANMNENIYLACTLISDGFTCHGSQVLAGTVKCGAIKDTRMRSVAARNLNNFYMPM